MPPVAGLLVSLASESALSRGYVDEIFAQRNRVPLSGKLGKDQKFPCSLDVVLHFICTAGPGGEVTGRRGYLIEDERAPAGECGSGGELEGGARLVGSVRVGGGGGGLVAVLRLLVLRLLLQSLARLHCVMRCELGR